MTEPIITADHIEAAWEAHVDEVRSSFNPIVERTARAIAKEAERSRIEIETLRAELFEIKEGYHALDKNWSCIHDLAVDACRAALAMPEASVPEMVQKIQRLMRRAEWSGRKHSCIAVNNYCNVCGKDMTPRVFWDEDSVYVIAYSHEDAQLVYSEHIGYPLSLSMLEWSLFPPEQEISIRIWIDGPNVGTIAPLEEDAEHPDIAACSQSARFWALKGRGFLCSTDH